MMTSSLLKFIFVAANFHSFGPGIVQATNSRRVSQEHFLSYEPYTTVTDYAAVDLDQKNMESSLAEGTDKEFDMALTIYTNGSFSGSYAEILLDAPLQLDVAKGVTILGISDSGRTVHGTTPTAFKAGNSLIQVLYYVSPIQENWSDCHVGGNPDPNTEGCFAPTGALEIGELGDYTYSYNPLQENFNARTLQDFSTQALDKMYNCVGPRCPHQTYNQFYEYYGVFDYANQWVLAAFNNGSTNFASGNADFQIYGVEGRTEAIKKATTYMNVWMYIISKMEDAIYECSANIDSAMNSWDAAVALYTGSESKRTGGNGYMLYTLAQNLCPEFRTCLTNGDIDIGMAKVNKKIFQQFHMGQQNLLSQDCNAITTNVERISELMVVPLIQGTISHAYKMDKAYDTRKQINAGGSTFAAAVLPLLYHCSSDDANIIYNNMRVSNENTSYEAVKKAFERNYGCMGMTEEDVGEIPEEPFLSYLPITTVTDYAAIDLDQKAIEIALAAGTNQGRSTAFKIYTQGAFSKSYAEIALDAPLPVDVAEGVAILGSSVGGGAVRGITAAAFNAGDSIIQVLYYISPVQQKWSNCHVGGNPDPNTEGCFAPTGALEIGEIGNYTYTYNPLKANFNARTLQGLSTQALDKMYNCAGPRCPHQTYNKFYQYYGVFDYANQWILAALIHGGTNFAKGNAHFLTVFRTDGINEVVRKGTAYMNVWMYIIMKMEDAIDNCNINTTAEIAANPWDAAVALYAGSETKASEGSRGYLLYSLAQETCRDFGTCLTATEGGPNDAAAGMAKVNKIIFDEFVLGQKNLLSKDCKAIETNVERITSLMVVPLIQGLLKQAYKMDIGNDSREETVAEGATFAAAILPLVAACSPANADIVYNDMHFGKNKNSVHFRVVKVALEWVYDCLNITCADVGGLVNHATGEYYAGAQPCNDSSTTTTQSTTTTTTTTVTISSAIERSGVSSSSAKIKEEDSSSSSLQEETSSSSTTGSSAFVESSARRASAMTIVMLAGLSVLLSSFLE